MSEKKITEKKDPEKKAAKKKKGFRGRIAKWFRELRSELKKVTWPTPKQISNNTWVVLFMMVISAVALWAVDFVAGLSVDTLIRLFS